MNQFVRIQGASSWGKPSGFQELATLLLGKLVISKGRQNCFNLLRQSA